MAMTRWCLFNAPRPQACSTRKPVTCRTIVDVLPEDPDHVCLIRASRPQEIGGLGALSSVNIRDRLARARSKTEIWSAYVPGGGSRTASGAQRSGRTTDRAPSRPPSADPTGAGGVEDSRTSTRIDAAPVKARLSRLWAPTADPNTWLGDHRSLEGRQLARCVRRFDLGDHVGASAKVVLQRPDRDIAGCVLDAADGVVAAGVRSRTGSTTRFTDKTLAPGPSRHRNACFGQRRHCASTSSA